MKSKINLLADRRDAAIKLKEMLPLDKMKGEQWQLVAVSRGGLEMASYLNERLGLPIDFLFSEPIFAPHNSECEVARVSEMEEIVMHENLVDSFDVQVDYIYGEAKRKHEEKILSQMYQYRKGRRFASMADKTVLLIDEGAESGMKLMTAIKTVMTMNPKAIYAAVGVLPTDVLDSLDPLVDSIYCLYDIGDFVETKSYYVSLPDVDDETIETILGE